MMNKEEKYQKAVDEITSFIGPDGYNLTNVGKMATIASLLHQAFPEWPFVGFYQTVSPEILEIGPYQGPVLACGRIPFGKGVCGTAAQQKQTIIVDDVHSFPNYIACDDKTRSEIVIPILKDNDVTGVLDVDSSDIAAFDDIDKKYLEKITSLIS